MNKPDTLLILTPGFPANEADSTCIPPQQLFVKALKQQCTGTDIIILTFEYPFKASNYTWHGIPVIAFGGRNRGGLLRILNWIDIWAILKQLHRKRNITGLLSFWLGDCAFIGNTFSKKTGIPHYCWLLGQDARPGNKYAKLTKVKGDRLIALSDALANTFQKNYGVLPRYIIPPGIDTSAFGATVTDRDIDILGAGSLIPLKRYDVFINVINRLIKTHPQIKAVICGKGPEIAKLEALVAKHKLEKNIELKGELPHKEVLSLMQRSKLFLHTSAYEGFGMVLSEALYAGAHVISFTSPMNDMPWQFHKAKDEAGMLAIVAALLNDSSLGHQPVLQNSIDVTAAKVAQLFMPQPATDPREGTTV
jgi:glycosyltransferase involved in cell wall biosynthesis